MLALRLLAYLLWIPALFAVIAAVILPVVGSGPFAVRDSTGSVLVSPALLAGP